VTKNQLWDAMKAEMNFRKHRVTFEEAGEALFDPLAKTHPDEAHSHEEDRHVAIGSTANGRILAVSYTIRNDQIWIISARSAQPAERRRYMKERDILRDAALAEDDDDMLSDYGHLEDWQPLNFTSVRPVALVVLEPDVYNSFLNSDEVNAALRELIAEGRYPARPDAPESALPKSRRRK
jgi:uncharacterized DUF497 family protein